MLISCQVSAEHLQTEATVLGGVGAGGQEGMGPGGQEGMDSGGQEGMGPGGQEGSWV